MRPVPLILSNNLNLLPSRALQERAIALHP
nr:MAG TPA: hypothetical protein [Caudoviricetes sp.]